MPPAPPPLGVGLVVRQVRVSDPDVILLRAILEAYEGLAVFYGDGSGVITLATPCSCEEQLDSLIAALRRELSIQLLAPASGPLPQAPG